MGHIEMSSSSQELELLIKAGRWVEASVLCTSLCKANPHNAHLWHAAANIQIQLGHVGQALSYYRQAESLEPASVKVLFSYASALQLSGDLQQAIAVLNRLIRYSPETASAHVALGRIYCNQGRYDEARGCFEQAQRLRPETLDAVLGLIQVWTAMDRPGRAIDCFEKAISIQPDSHELICDLGMLHATMGKFKEAGSACARARALKPDYLPAIALQASLLRQQQRYNDALDLIGPIVQRGEKHICIIQEYLDLCRWVGRCSEAVALSREVTSQSGISDQDLMCLYFSTGHALDHLGLYDEAFEQFRKANGLRGVGMDSSGMNNAVSNISTVIDTDPGLTGREHPAGARKMIFIVGMPRSGTTLAEQILSSHSDVYGAGETTILRDVIKSIPELVGVTAKYPYCIRKLDESAIDVLRQAYLSRLPDVSQDFPVVVDKQLGNFLWIGMIRLLFPDAKIVHCTRDPLDTCLSCYFNNFRTLPFTYSLTALGRTWKAYRKLMDHWHALSMPIMESCYETLIDDIEGESRRLLAYCGLDWDDRCLRFHENDREVATVSKDQVNRPVYRESVGRWRNYEAHLAELKQALNAPD